jgi:membrane associated rhomboid family serine protease
MGWEGNGCHISAAGFVPIWSWIKWFLRRLILVTGLDPYPFQVYQSKTCLFGIPIEFLPDPMVRSGRYLRLLNLTHKWTFMDLILLLMVFQFIVYSFHQYMNWNYEMPSPHQVRSKPWILLTCHFYHSSWIQCMYSVYSFYTIAPLMMARIGHDHFFLFLVWTMLLVSMASWYYNKWSNGFHSVIFAMKLFLFWRSHNPVDQIPSIATHVFFSGLDGTILLITAFIGFAFARMSFS